VNDVRILVFEPFDIVWFGIATWEETDIEREIVVPMEMGTSFFEVFELTV
jgi:hypothetical protein